MQGVCKLCDRTAKLSLSHILPKSHTRRMRQRAPQVVLVSVENPPIARKSNGEHVERLLCAECEHLIKSKYEDYGTRLFVNRQFITESNDRVNIAQFKYETYFLYVISILWRATVSSLSAYKAIQGLRELAAIFKPCLKDETLTTSLAHRFKLDDFIKLTIVRITDPEHEIPQSTIDSLILGLNVERGDTVDDGFHCHFMVDGFLVIASIFPPTSKALAEWRPTGRVLNRSHLSIPKVSYARFKILTDGFTAIAKSPDPFNIKAKA